jgi:hypothetical protein
MCFARISILTAVYLIWDDFDGQGIMEHGVDFDRGVFVANLSWIFYIANSVRGRIVPMAIWRADEIDT